MIEIKGFSTINHAIRVKLELTLQEYVILDFLYSWQIKNKDLPKKEDWHMCLGIDNSNSSVISILSNLVKKQFLNLDHIVISSDFISSADIDKVTKINEKPKIKRYKNTSSKEQFIPPTQKEVSDYFFINGYDPNKGIEFWKYYRDGEPAWHDGQGTPLRSWKQKARSVWFKPHNLLPIVTENDIKKLVM